MLLEIFSAVLIGILFGIVTGLVPGVHINLVAAILLALSAALLKVFQPLTLAVFIVSMSITHTFLDFIPAIFLGAPEESTVLGVLPGHRMLLEGRGYEAVKLSIIGSYFGLLIMLLSTPLVLWFIPVIYSKIEFIIPYLLIAISSFTIFQEKSRFWALFLFLISGVLGIATLNILTLKQPLFPLLTGLFGTSMVFSSIYQKTRVPEQRITSSDLSAKELGKAIGAGIISSPLPSFLPGIGASQAALIGSHISGKISERGFLVLIGAIGTIVAGLNFIALYGIGKSRSGTAAAVSALLGGLTKVDLYLLLSASLLAGSISVFLGIAFAKASIRMISRIDYTKVSIVVLIFLTALSIIISGPISLIVLITGTSIGLLAIKRNVRKLNLMGCLIIPAVLWLLI